MGVSMNVVVLFRYESVIFRVLSLRIVIHSFI